MRTSEDEYLPDMEEKKRSRPKWMLPLVVTGLGLGAAAAYLLIRKIKKNPEIIRAAEMMIVQGINDMLRPIMENKEKLIAALQAGASQMMETRETLAREILNKE